MSKIAPFGLLALLVVIIGMSVYWWLDQPRRTTGAFVGNMYHERYEDAASMLQPPCAIQVKTDGGLAIVDQNGQSTSVPKVQLPFIVGVHDGDQDHDFLMTALGPSTEGILHDPPVTLYLTLDGSEVSIESVEVHQ